jgi:hypothetical protein
MASSQYGLRQNDPYSVNSPYENVLGQDRSNINPYGSSANNFPPSRYMEPTSSNWQPDITQKKGGFQVEPAKKNAIKNRIKEIIDLVQN